MATALLLLVGLLLLAAAALVGNLFSSSSTWRSALFKALVIQAVVFGFLSLGWFGLVGGFGGADNPLWFYVAAVLQFPASLLFSTVLGAVTKVTPDGVRNIEVAGVIVAVMQYVLLSVAIKKTRDYWLA
jgi:hypothetical protein